MKSCRVNKPRLAPLDVRVLGTACCALNAMGASLVAVVPLIDHLVGHDQMVLGVNGDLDIVADGGGAFAASVMTHSVDSQGVWNVRCWVYGSDSICDRQRCRPG